MPSIFSRIAAGEIPCHRVYEDEHVIAFLDIAPVSRGHVLV
ncbi:MAG: HIT domain-containing protein, partial [Phycisphaerales bacterium]